jgi:hypothetical protein
MSCAVLTDAAQIAFTPGSLEVKEPAGAAGRAGAARAAAAVEAASAQTSIAQSRSRPRMAVFY